MSRYLHFAISNLATTFENNLPTEMTDVEGTNSVTLVRPREYISAYEPGRNVTPFVMIYEDPNGSFDFTHDGVGQRPGNEFFEVYAYVSYVTNLGQDIQTGSANLRHVLTAMIQVVENSRRLGVSRLDSEITGANLGLVGEDLDNESSIRRIATMRMRIWGHSPPI